MTETGMVELALVVEVGLVELLIPKKLGPQGQFRK